MSLTVCGRFFLSSSQWFFFFFFFQCDQALCTCHRKRVFPGDYLWVSKLRIYGVLSKITLNKNVYYSKMISDYFFQLLSSNFPHVLVLCHIKNSAIVWVNTHKSMCPFDAHFRLLCNSTLNYIIRFKKAVYCPFIPTFPRFKGETRSVIYLFNAYVNGNRSL